MRTEKNDDNRQRIRMLAAAIKICAQQRNPPNPPKIENTVPVTETGRCNALVTAMSGISGSKLHLFNIKRLHSSFHVHVYTMYMFTRVHPHEGRPMQSWPDRQCVLCTVGLRKHVC